MDIWQYFCFWCHLGICTMQEPPSFRDKSILMSLWFSMASTQYNNTRITKTLSPWGIHQILICIDLLQIWHPQVGSLIPFLMLMIDTAMLTYIPVQHWLPSEPWHQESGIQMQLHQCLLTRASSIKPHIFPSPIWHFFWYSLKKIPHFFFPSPHRFRRQANFLVDSKTSRISSHFLQVDYNTEKAK